MSAALIAVASLGNIVERIGAYGGLASMIGLGVLALLYFAQAREVKRLREWAGRAPERAAEVEQRVQADAQRRIIAQPQTPAGQVAATPAGAVPAPGSVPLPGAVPPARLPTAGLTGEAATRAAATAAAVVAARAAHPSAPVAGPAGQLARPNLPPNLPPTLPPTPNVAPQGTGATATPAPPASPPLAGTKPGTTTAPPVPVSTPPSPVAKTTTPAAALAANRPTATASSPASASPAKPRVVTQPAAVANGGGQETRESAAARPPPPPVTARRPDPISPPQDDGEGTSPGRILAIVGGVLGLVLVVGLIVILSGGGDSPKKAPNSIGSVPTAQPGTPPSANAAPAGAVVPGDTATTVLNGTTTAGLASTVAAKLKKSGFKVGQPSDNVDQTLTATVVYFSAGNERAAKAVAKSIGIQASVVTPEDRDIAVAAPDADVVVTVGSDLIQ